MKEKLTKEIAYKSLQEFFSKKPIVLFGTGTSCDLDPKFGMDALRDCLLKNVSTDDLNTKQKGQWESVCKALEQEGANFEEVMDNVQDANLVHIIIDLTASHVKSLDEQYSIKIIKSEVYWVALDLLKRMVDRDRVVHVATTNYDLLAEYSFEKNDIAYITGYSGGICRVSDWEQSEMNVRRFEDTLTKGKVVKKVLKFKKHIKLYKLHGSLNTFFVGNQIVENNSWIHRKPCCVERLMITPGMVKHKHINDNRNELFGRYDAAVNNHSAFLFIGFGFNDTQIVNTKLLYKLKDQQCHGLIITRDSNDRIEKILKDCKNLWLICKNQKENNNGTRIFNSCFKDWLYVDEQIWDCKVFTKQILGG